MKKYLMALLLLSITATATIISVPAKADTCDGSNGGGHNDGC